MTGKTEHSPLPWRVEESIAGLKNIIVDAPGFEVCSVLEHPKDPERDEANAARIVAAVNENEKMRNLVWRMLPWVERTRDMLCARCRSYGTRIEESPAIFTLTQIIIDANAALGREAKDGKN